MEKKIAVLTGGGDCPGLNAVIRAIVETASNFNYVVYGLRQGFQGLLNPIKLNKLEKKEVSELLPVGGTILGTSSHGNPFIKKNNNKIIDRTDEFINNFKKLNFCSLIAIGGDGTLTHALNLYKKGIPVVGVPKTIDNDLSGTVITFGFDTAVSTATEALDKLHTTAKSHNRTMVVEVMGRYCGWIALHAGISGGADIILIPEIPFDIEKISKKVKDCYRKKNYCMIVVAEGVKPLSGELFVKEYKKESIKMPVLGGVAEWLSKEITKRTGKETRSLVLGHLQRGGSPTTFDRLLATRFGAASVKLINQKKFGYMVALHPPNITEVKLKDAVKKLKKVDVDSDIIETARNLNISFGD